MLRPFLLVGIGGSGGKTLRIIRHELRRKLVELEWEGEHDLPTGWQFLHIDVPTHADGDDADLPPQLPQSDYTGLVSAGLDYRTLDAAIAKTGRTREGDAIAGWRPEARQVTVPVEKGAGQYRALGRAITLASLKQIKSAVDGSIRALNGRQVTSELRDLTLKFGGTPLDVGKQPVAIVVSSIAGGSGAGGIIDICDVLRATGEQWAGQSIGVLYCPDVFDYLPEQRRRGTRPNAVATITELLAGYWNKNGPSNETSEILSLRGVNLGDTDRLGPRYPFLVGARNESITYRTQNEVYQAMGRSLASWVMSVELQDKIDAYISGNWSVTAISVSDAFQLKTEDMETPFTGLGSARVGLGRDRFRDYASQRLARSAVERLLSRHEDLRPRGDERPSKAIAQDVADSAFGTFLVTSQLDERGEEHNDILDAIRPTTRQSQLASLVDDLTAQVTANISPTTNRRVSEWRALISQRILDNMTRLLDEFDVGNKEGGRAWVDSIQAQLRKTAAATIAMEGLPVTALLFRKLGEELRAVRVELEQEADKHARQGANVDQLVEQSLRKVGGDQIPPSHPQVREAVRYGVFAISSRAESRLRTLVVSILPDFIDNVVTRLAEEIDRVDSALHEEYEPSTGQISPVSMWPESDEVPPRLRPAANEFVLETPDDYPETLQLIVQRTFPGTASQDALRQAVLRTIVGAEDVMADNQQAVEQPSTWIPRSSDFHTELSAPARASFEISVSADDLLERAREWVVRPGTPSGSFVREGLKSYLESTGDPTQAATRMNRFVGQFGAALDAAQPLVGIKKAVLVAVHGVDAVRSDAFFSEFPFSAQSDAGRAVRSLLESKRAWRTEMEGAFVPSGRDLIDVFSVLAEPYEPAVFDSLMKPMAEDWGAKRQTPDGRKEFWRWRRSRNLDEFIPAAPAVRTAMVRGWFTASLLGQIRVDPGSATIFVPNEVGGNGRWYEFPRPLLAGAVTQRHDLLPAVLESLPLAFISVNVDTSLDAIIPYQRLRLLGTGAGGGLISYERMNAELERWIGQGVLPQGAPKPSFEHAASSEVAWDARREVIEARFERQREVYESLFQEQEHRQETNVVEAFELRADISLCLDQLVGVIQHYVGGSGAEDIY